MANGNFGQSQFQNAYELAPIILTNGIANGYPGAQLPLLQITDGPLDSLDTSDTNAFFGHFRPMPGATLIANDIGEFPFANQAVAANAIIARPLRISLMMDCPAQVGGGYQGKLQVITALKQALDNHVQSGGTFTVATPSFIYTNCILVLLRDVSRPDSKQAQNAWQWDFERPLLALEQLTQVYNSQMAKIAAGLQQTGQPAWSGVAPAVGSTVTNLGSLGGGTAPNLLGTATSGINQSQSP